MKNFINKVLDYCLANIDNQNICPLSSHGLSVSFPNLTIELWVNENNIMMYFNKATYSIDSPEDVYLLMYKVNKIYERYKDICIDKITDIIDQKDNHTITNINNLFDEN